MGFVPISMVPDVGTQGTPLRTVGKAWFMKSMHILSEVCYFIYNHNKRQQPIVSLGRGQGTVMGCWKASVHTADMDVAVGTVIVDLIKSKWARYWYEQYITYMQVYKLLCLLSYIALEIICTCLSQFPMYLGKYTSTSAYIIYAYTPLKIRICMAQLIHFGEIVLHLTVCSRGLTHFVFVL